jgi:hypothetical protein
MNKDALIRYRLLERIGHDFLDRRNVGFVAGGQRMIRVLANATR